MVTRHGLVGDQQYLLLEWIEVGKGSTKVFKKAGSGLALLHGKVQPYFGFEEDNYIGNLHQDNRREESWELFYMERRLKPLVKKLFDAGAYSKADLLGTEKFYKNLENIFPKEPPSLLHGDLWSGNFMASVTDEPVLIDPAVYNGHREMDLAMTRLFGGFGEEFYRAYHETYPLEKGWEKRVPIAQLYPLLVHAVLFGGHYVAKTRDIFKRGR